MEAVGSGAFRALRHQAEGQLVSLLLPEGRRRVISVFISSPFAVILTYELTALHTASGCAGLGSHWRCA